MKRVFFALCLLGCSAPRVEITVHDGSVDGGDAAAEDTAPYVFPDARRELADGGLCQGHDEDGDGWPDECDDCPNLPDPEQGKSPLSALGSLCTPSPPFESATKRVFFDPFVRLGSKWVVGGGEGAFTVGDRQPDLLSGGRAYRELQVAVARLGLGNRTTVATLPVSRRLGIGGCSMGIVARVSADLATFFACGISSETFVLLRTPKGGCAVGEDCALVELAFKTIPRLVDRDRVGVRFSVADTPTGGRLECRLYALDNLVTLSADPSQYVLGLDVAQADWLAGGDVGVYARWTEASLPSIDVIASP